LLIFEIERMIPKRGNEMKLLITIFAFISFSANAQSWRDCVRNSIGPGGCESIGPGGGQSIGPGGGMSIGPSGCKSIGPGGGMSLDNPRGLNPDTMRPYGW
jgi:hypothetical protein